MSRRMKAVHVFLVHSMGVIAGRYLIKAFPEAVDGGMFDEPLVGLACAILVASVLAVQVILEDPQ